MQAMLKDMYAGHGRIRVKTVGAIPNVEMCKTMQLICVWQMYMINPRVLNYINFTRTFHVFESATKCSTSVRVCVCMQVVSMIIFAMHRSRL